ncbi:YhcH/YjgK/YiaL family protein [Flavobacterium defluvii]|uniref:YhcH/YjgK/YiaL family protein n=1 Tax=Flavobacterium defluvii TaxID=370979 RepID=A0A1M5NYU1_9FLAO|nr:YhcH/YjgK/YiaL family protein [Flavobacterium defluvii]SHG94736.1 YhcH/YjgK/YiaL family protein [Flavobacterium defluvii]
MITDTIENLSNYKVIYPEITELIDILKKSDLESLHEKTISNEITLIPIQSKKVSESFDENILEAHKKLMDIHITLNGIDVIAYADVNREVEEYKKYIEADDYALFKSNTIKEIIIPKGYFCIIPNNFAHMALYKGHSDVKKIVVKLRADL